MFYYWACLKIKLDGSVNIKENVSFCVKYEIFAREKASGVEVWLLITTVRAFLCIRQEIR